MATSDDGDSIMNFMFYMFFIAPATAWFLRPGRFPKDRALLYAVGFLIAVAAIKTVMELQEMPPNFYEILGVTRSSTMSEVRRAYKAQSLVYHPDKNKSPDAELMFNEMRRAYEVLSDDAARSVYDRSGEAGLEHGGVGEIEILIQLGVFYVVWAVFAFLLTLGKSNSSARNWVFTGGILMAAIELSIKLNGYSPLPGVLTQTPPFALVRIMHMLFPAFLNGCRTVAAHTYVDLDQRNLQIMLAILNQNKEISLALHQLQVEVMSLNVKKATGGAAPDPVVVTGKLKELEEQRKLQRGKLDKAGQDALEAQQKKAGGFNWNFALMMLAMFVLQKVF